jgi:hypothetical protein
VRPEPPKAYVNGAEYGRTWGLSERKVRMMIKAGALELYRLQGRKRDVLRIRNVSPAEHRPQT